jgi:hypothetical protein
MQVSLSTHRLHSIENLYRPLIPPPIKILCYSAIGDLFKYLPESKANPQDIAARQKLQLAAWMSLWPIKLEKFGYLHKLSLKTTELANFVSLKCGGPITCFGTQTWSNIWDWAWHYIGEAHFIINYQSHPLSVPGYCYSV